MIYQSEVEIIIVFEIDLVRITKNFTFKIFNSKYLDSQLPTSCGGLRLAPAVWLEFSSLRHTPLPGILVPCGRAWGSRWGNDSRHDERRRWWPTTRDRTGSKRQAAPLLWHRLCPSQWTPSRSTNYSTRSVVVCLLTSTWLTHLTSLCSLSLDHILPWSRYPLSSAAVRL